MKRRRTGGEAEAGVQPQPAPGPGRPPVRLQKLLAEAGVASRRAAERLIADGHVTVNGVPVREPGSVATPERDRIAVDGIPLRPPAPHSYLLLHKPPGVVTSLHDPHAERTIADLLPRDAPRLYPVGRLDRESEGLLLLTDDGALTERLLHPRYGIEREYAALVRGDLSAGALVTLRAGVVVEGVQVVPLAVIVTLPPPALGAASPPGTRWLRITLAEGRKREVRVMCAAVHLHVLRLIRVRFGPLTLGDLPPGKSRPLTEDEHLALLSLTERRPGPSRAVAGTRNIDGGAPPLRRGDATSAFRGSADERFEERAPRPRPALTSGRSRTRGNPALESDADVEQPFGRLADKRDQPGARAARRPPANSTRPAVERSDPERHRGRSEPNVEKSAEATHAPARRTGAGPGRTVRAPAYHAARTRAVAAAPASTRKHPPGG